ncbi:alpha/beta fold hydrolase [Nocardioides ultimimeridianus]
MTSEGFAEQYQRPSELLWRTEALRTAGDFAALWLSWPRLAPLERGDGHGVLVLPGFLADDASTVTMRTVLCAHGYRVRGWSLGTNLGPTARLWRGAQRRLERLYADTGRPVTLIGHSLGGIFARELARRNPELVRQVITLGSPYRLSTSDAPDVTTVGHLYRALRGLHTAAFDAGDREEDRTPLEVPATSIYSRRDGVVPWRTCIDLERPEAENVEVGASHCGMGVHPDVLAVILDRLRLPAGGWAPYAGGSGRTTVTALAS